MSAPAADCYGKVEYLQAKSSFAVKKRTCTPQASPSCTQVPAAPANGCVSCDDCPSVAVGDAGPSDDLANTCREAPAPQHMTAFTGCTLGGEKKVTGCQSTESLLNSCNVADVKRLVTSSSYPKMHSQGWLAAPLEDTLGELATCEDCRPARTLPSPHSQKHLAMQNSEESQHHMGNTQGRGEEAGRTEKVALEKGRPSSSSTTTLPLFPNDHAVDTVVATTSMTAAQVCFPPPPCDPPSDEDDEGDVAKTEAPEKYPRSMAPTSMAGGNKGAMPKACSEIKVIIDGVCYQQGMLQTTQLTRRVPCLLATEPTSPIQATLPPPLCSDATVTHCRRTVLDPCSWRCTPMAEFDTLDNRRRLARMRLTLDLSDYYPPLTAVPYNPAKRLAENAKMVANHSPNDEHFHTLPSATKANPYSSTLSPTLPRHLPQPNQQAGRIEVARSPTLLDELHSRYCGWRQLPQVAEPGTDTPATGGGLDECAMMSPVPRTAVTRSQSHRSPSRLKDPADNIVKQATSVEESNGKAAQMNMFGNVDKMFSTLPSPNSPSLVAAKMQKHSAPSRVGSPDHSIAQLVELNNGSPNSLSPSPKTSTSSSSSKLARAFSLSPQILRRKYRTAAETDSKHVATMMNSDIREDLAMNSSLQSTWGKKKTHEIEVLEACSWLMEAGFPQYLQLFEEGHFPLELDSVERDHAFLEARLVQSLFRRLRILNKCAHMKLEVTNRKLFDFHADDDELCALSDKWRINQKSGRWLHVDMTSSGEKRADSRNLSADVANVSRYMPLLSSQKALASPLPDVCGDAMAAASRARRFEEDAAAAANVKRSRAVRPGNLLRSLGGSLRVPRKARREPIVAGGDSVLISGPLLVSSPEMDARLQRLGCVQINSESSSPMISTKAQEQRVESNADDALNNNIAYVKFSSSDWWKAGAYEDEKREASYVLPADYVPGTFPRALSKASLDDVSIVSSRPNGGRVSRSISLRHVRQCPDTNESLRTCRHSVYDNVPAPSDIGEEQLQLEVALRELLELNNVGRDSISREDVTSVVRYPTPDLVPELPSSVATTPMASLPATPLDNVDAQLRAAAESRNDVGIEPDIVSASGSSNQEAASDHDISGSKEDLSDAAWHRERRDSGVGSSLTREPSETKKKPRLRWHSFVKSHRPSLNSENQHASRLPAGQLMVLQRLCTLNISSLMEEYCPALAQLSGGWTTLSFPKFVKKSKAPDYSHKRVFGVPLSVVQQRSGQPLPQCVLYAMRYLRKTATDAVGIFRKSGVKSRIEKLHNDLEENPDTTEFDGVQAYDVADLLKKYFRELPECLLTTKLSPTFLAIQQHVPFSQRLEALQSCALLLPCENREALEALLCFLSDMADHSKLNQMTASNLAVCFAPSLFDVYSGRSSEPRTTRGGGSNHTIAMPDQKELLDQKVAHECLTQMIVDCKKLFKIPEDFLAKCHCSYMEAADPVPWAALSTDCHAHVESCIQGLLKESREGFKGWVGCPSHEQDVELAYKKVGDGNPLRLWKACIDVEAPPVDVLDRVLRERHLWDEDFAQWRTVEKLDAETDVFHYVCSSMPPQPSRDYVELRSWRTELPNGACILVSHSIDCEGSPATSGGGIVRGVVLASSYLVEPCGAGRSRVTHVSRVDTRGRPPDWYNRLYGQLEASCLLRLRNTFRQMHSAAAPPDVPETDV